MFQIFRFRYRVFLLCVCMCCQGYYRNLMRKCLFAFEIEEVKVNSHSKWTTTIIIEQLLLLLWTKHITAFVPQQSKNSSLQLLRFKFSNWIHTQSSKYSARRLKKHVYMLYLPAKINYYVFNYKLTAHHHLFSRFARRTVSNQKPKSNSTRKYFGTDVLVLRSGRTQRGTQSNL